MKIKNVLRLMVMNIGEVRIERDAITKLPICKYDGYTLRYSNKDNKTVIEILDEETMETISGAFKFNSLEYSLLLDVLESNSSQVI